MSVVGPVRASVAVFSVWSGFSLCLNSSRGGLSPVIPAPRGGVKNGEAVEET